MKQVSSSAGQRTLHTHTHKGAPHTHTGIYMQQTEKQSKASASHILTITCLAKLILQAGHQFRHLQYSHMYHHASDHQSHLVCKAKPKLPRIPQY